MSNKGNKNEKEEGRYEKEGKGKERQRKGIIYNVGKDAEEEEVED